MSEKVLDHGPDMGRRAFLECGRKAIENTVAVVALGMTGALTGSSAARADGLCGGEPAGIEPPLSWYKTLGYSV